MSENSSRKRLSRARSAWLEAQSSAWVGDGLIDAAARSRILASYDVEPAERRSLLALMVLGALMFGIGVLLLIGYNWAQIPAAGKIAIIMGSVALAFAASAVTFARKQLAAGEALAFIGVLLFGNAIWLIAQVLHIRGHFADAFMWWAVGALATAWLVRSHVVGAGAAFLVFLWMFAAGHTLDRPVASFAVIFLAAITVAYQLQSRWMLAPALVAAITWACWAPDRVQPVPVSVGTAALMACAFHALGACRRAQNPLGRTWQLTGLAALLVVLVPLLVTDFHGMSTHPVPWSSLIVAVPAILATAGLAVRRMTSQGPEGTRAAGWLADTAIVLTAAVISIWLCLLALGVSAQSAWAYGATFGFSLLALGLSVAFIRKALGSDSGLDLTFGVLFALAFLIVRWVSLIDSMLWSGVMLLIASAGFFAVARLWQRRERRPQPVLTAASTGAVP